VAVLAYLRTIFVACSQYPKNDVIVRSSTLVNIPSFMNALVWIRLELRVFFSLLICGVLFIFLSFFRKPFNLLKSYDEELDQAPTKGEKITDKIVANEDNSQ
jgi:ssDNA-binding Zn-finger/Zn-ribbon topoisomerase 1